MKILRSPVAAEANGSGLTAAASAAVAKLVTRCEVDEADIPLLVLACASPTEWATEDAGPLLDGAFAAQVVHKVLASNGLFSTVPLGVWSPCEEAELAAIDVATSIIAAEGISCAVAVAVLNSDPAKAVATYLPGTREEDRD